MEIENFDEETDFSNTADDILGILETRKTLIYSLHTLLDQYELHLDSITKRYKSMTITLLLATCAAVGFLFSSELIHFQINKLTIASLVFLFGVIGTFSVWILDVQVFHRFWGAFYVEEVKMEKQYPFLVDIGDSAASLDNIRARIYGSGNFYLSIIIVLTLASGTSFSFLFTNYLAKILALIMTSALCVAFVIIVKRASKFLRYAIDDLLNGMS